MVETWYVHTPKNRVGIAVQPAFSDDTNAQANARLIAAAPELYARLSEAREAIASLDRDALGWIEEPQARWPVREEMLHHIDAALAKARGEQ